MVFSGVLVWIIATLVFRLFGQFLLIPNNVTLTVFLFGLAVPLMLGMMILLYRWQSIGSADRPQAAMRFALPGMLLDVGSIAFFAQVFPNMHPSVNPWFAALMLWAYGLVLVSGFLPAVEASRRTV